mgnify:CR=1 FL=1
MELYKETHLKIVDLESNQRLVLDNSESEGEENESEDEVENDRVLLEKELVLSESGRSYFSRTMISVLVARVKKERFMQFAFN